MSVSACKVSGIIRNFALGKDEKTAERWIFLLPMLKSYLLKKENCMNERCLGFLMMMVAILLVAACSTAEHCNCG